MSWSGYIDSLLPAVDEAIIAGQDGAVWASSKGLTNPDSSCKVPQGEILSIIQGFNNPDELRSNGMHFRGEKYIVLNVKPEEREIGITAKKGSKGISVVRTKQTVIIGFYDGEYRGGNANMVMGKVQSYLLDSNY